MKKTIQHLLALALCVTAVPFIHAQTPAPLLQYNFNDTGSTSANTGSLGSAGDLTLYNAIGNGSGSRVGTAADLHSAPGTGVGGVGSAFDNTASTVMGGATVATSGYNGNRAQTTSTVSGALGALQSFTLEGWFKTDGSTMIGDGAKLMEMFSTTGGPSSSAAGFTLSALQNGRLTLNVNGITAVSGATGQTPYGATQTWVFFAVTFNGTLGANNVSFYVGSESDSVSLVSTVDLKQSSLTVSSTALGLAIGNGLSTNSRTVDGLMDGISLYGSTTGASGVLDQSQLETLRASAIPEPSTVALFAGISVLGLVAFRRRRR